MNHESYLIFGTLNEKDLQHLPEKAREDFEEYFETDAEGFEEIQYFVDPYDGSFAGLGVWISRADWDQSNEVNLDEFADKMDKARQVFKRYELTEPKLYHIVVEQLG